MEGLDDNGVDKSKISEEVKNEDSRSQKGGGERAEEEAEKESNDVVAVDINDDNGRSRNSESSINSETLCRICQLSKDESWADSQLIKLGCDCKGELAVSHRSCANTWFLQKRNRICEICRKLAKNISFYDVEDAFMNETRLVVPSPIALDASGESRCIRTLSFYCTIFIYFAFFVCFMRVTSWILA